METCWSALGEMFLEPNTLNETQEQPLSATGECSRMQDANEKPLDYTSCPRICNRCRPSPSHYGQGGPGQHFYVQLRSHPHLATKGT